MVRIGMVVLVVVLALGVFGLVGCSPADDSTSSENTTTQDSDASSPLTGTWENESATYFSSVTFAADGTGTAIDPDGDEASITWTLVDDYLEIEIDFDGMTDMTGGGFTWEEEGVSFSWDADGTFTKAE